MKSANGSLADQSQLADLLAEARAALERAQAVSRAVAECDSFLNIADFEKAGAALDACALLYPGDTALEARREEVRRREEEFRSDQAARKAFEESDWLVSQDRLDLAVRLMREKTAELPQHEPLLERLIELETRLEAWQRKRDVQAMLSRSAGLEQAGQWQAAAAVLDGALRTYPDSADLVAAAASVHRRLAADERQKKLVRRQELIRRSIDAQSWKQALELLESTEQDFPGNPELAAARSECEYGLKRSAVETVILETRKYMADGELAQAEQALREGRELHGPEPLLDTLLVELTAEKGYREMLLAAQFFFGQRRFEEAEELLAEIGDSPEARALLAATKQSRAAAEEDNFFENGREKALQLMHQGHFSQAADLLRNLLALFPGNPILERDLAAAQNGNGQEPKKAAADPPVAAVRVIPTVDTPGDTPVPLKRQELLPSPRFLEPEARPHRHAAAAIALIVLLSGTGAALKLSRTGGSAPKVASAKPAPAQPSADPRTAGATRKDPPTETPRDGVSSRSSAAPGRPNPEPERTVALREFVPPSMTRAASSEPPATLLQPPGTEAVVTVRAVPTLPSGFAGPSSAPPPPAVVPDPGPASKPAAPSSTIEPAQVVSRVLPAYPQAARSSHAFGTVQMEAAVDERGSVKHVKVLSGPTLLRIAAINAVLQWKCKPALLNGKPVASTLAVQIVFAEPGK